MKKSIKTNILRTIFSSSFILAAFATPTIAAANEYDEAINATQGQIDQMSAAQAELIAALDASYGEIAAAQENISALLAEVQEDNEAIYQLEDEVAKLEELIAKREDQLADQARSAQKNGGTTNFISAVASSDSISDFVGRLDVVRQMVAANKELVATQKEDKEALKANKESLEDAKEVKEANLAELADYQAALENQIAENEAIFAQLTNDISLAASHRDALIAEKAQFEEAQRQAAIAAAAQAEAEAQAAAAQMAAVEQSAAVQAAEAEAQAQEATAAQAAQVAAEAQAAVENTPEAETVVETVVNEATGATETVVNEAATQAAQAEVEATRQAAQAAAEQAQAQAAAAAQTAQAARGNVDALLAEAAQHVGTPYVWGGKNPGGFDCSGFVQYVYNKAYGVNVGGWTGEQQHAGEVISVDQAQAGDLYFWGSPNGSTSHVALATGNGNYIHAAQPGTPLGYSSVGNYTPNFAVRVTK